MSFLSSLLLIPWSVIVWLSSQGYSCNSYPRGAYRQGCCNKELWRGWKNISWWTVDWETQRFQGWVQPEEQARPLPPLCSTGTICHIGNSFLPCSLLALKMYTVFCFGKPVFSDCAHSPAVIRSCKLFATSWNWLDGSLFAASEVHQYSSLRTAGVRTYCSTKGCRVWKILQRRFSEKEKGRKKIHFRQWYSFFFYKKLLCSSSILLFSFCLLFFFFLSTLIILLHPIIFSFVKLLFTVLAFRLAFLNHII